MERRRDREREIQAERIKQRLIRLAARADLLPSSDFPPPAPGKQGTGVGFMPEDLHSIHIFPAHADIREAR